MLDWIGNLRVMTHQMPTGDDGGEAEMVARAKADRRDFAPLYARYLEPVYRFCYRRLGDRETAEDATSQTFYNALAALPRFRDGSFRAWLFTIAHNATTDALRRRRPQQPLAEAAEPADGDPTPEEAAVARDERRNLRALVSRLSDDQRQVVELRLAGLTGPEIADLLGRSPASVKMLQFRALERLRVLSRVTTGAAEVPHGTK
ncbi:MAG: RNA polymerase sigma factor [Chloroflexota bacterium]